MMILKNFPIRSKLLKRWFYTSCILHLPGESIQRIFNIRGLYVLLCPSILDNYLRELDRGTDRQF